MGKHLSCTAGVHRGQTRNMRDTLSGTWGLQCGHAGGCGCNWWHLLSTTHALQLCHDQTQLADGCSTAALGLARRQLPAHMTYNTRRVRDVPCQTHCLPACLWFSEVHEDSGHAVASIVILVFMAGTRCKQGARGMTTHNKQHIKSKQGACCSHCKEPESIHWFVEAC